MIGTTFGPYRIESLLGRGGMGEVYRAVDTAQGGRRVALKVLTPALSGDAPFAARFRREAEIAARLTEPHVVPIHRYGEIDGRLFLDMQLVDGRNVADVIAADGLLDPERALAVLEQVAGALDAAHAEGLVHRDVKPSNILLTHPGGGRVEFAYLLDFGIARAVDPGSRTALTRTGTLVGTLSYMAPERFLAQPAGPAADVYALACVLHEVLTGSRPYPGTGYAEQVAGHVHEAPPRPSVLRPGLPAALDAVVARGMAKDPAARFPTAGELVEAAHIALAGSVMEPVMTVTAGPPEAPTVVNPQAANPTAMASWVPPVSPRPPWAPQAYPGRRRRWWLPVLGVAVLAVAALATALVTTGPATTAADATAQPDPGAPIAALPSGGPITERVLVGAAPDDGSPVVTELDGRPVLVVLRSNGIDVLDPATGERVGQRIEDALGLAATAAWVDGRTVVITGGVDQVIRLWDVTTGKPLARTFTGPADAVGVLTVATVDGRAVLVAGSHDRTVRRWDLTTGAPIGEPLTGIEDRVSQLVVTRLDGRPVLLAKGFRGPIHSWDLATGAPVAPPIPTVYDQITTAELPDGPVVLSAPAILQTRVVDLRSGVQLGGYPPRLGGTPPGVAAVVAGRPLFVDSSSDAIQILDMRTGEPVGKPLTGHEKLIHGLVVMTVADTPFLVSTSRDRSIRIWDLAARVKG